MCLPGNATGGGDICVTLCLQRGGGGGGGGHEKIFRNVAIFWRFAPLLPKRQKIPTFRKNFSCPLPPPPPPPVACPGRHYTTSLKSQKTIKPTESIIIIEPLVASSYILKLIKRTLEKTLQLHGRSF